ncbi:hypothetical protein B0H14DRAFT_3779498 [Mycena olivaceomarginata]|nr:hypothetical protein B0H14DRAFT_3779498 [Mycena olivaceomarginata]
MSGKIQNFSQIQAYIDKYTSLLPFLANAPIGNPPSDEAPAEQISKAISLQSDVKFDTAPIGKHFGQTLEDVVTKAPYHAGDTVFARFVGANPRNNLRLEVLLDFGDKNPLLEATPDSEVKELLPLIREETEGAPGTVVTGIGWERLLDCELCGPATPLELLPLIMLLPVIWEEIRDPLADAFGSEKSPGLDAVAD